MLSFKRIRRTALLILCLIGLGACGFQPLYTAEPTVGSANGLVPFQDIAIAHMSERNGQYLRNQLIDSLYTQGRPQNPRYELRINNLLEDVTLLGIRKDASATRAQMSITATLQLIDKQQEGRVVLQRPLQATNSFNILDSQYTTQVSRNYARERALDELARLAVRQISLYFNRPDVTHEAYLSAN